MVDGRWDGRLWDRWDGRLWDRWDEIVDCETDIRWDG